MAEKGSKSVEIISLSNKREITAVICGNLLGKFLPVQLIYKRKTSRCHPSFVFPAGWNIAHAPNHWSTEKTMNQYINNVFLPFIEQTWLLHGEDKSAVIIMDNFNGQITDAVTQLLESHRVHIESILV